jgi:hypothetical protein
MWRMIPAAPPFVDLFLRHIFSGVFNSLMQSILIGYAGMHVQHPRLVVSKEPHHLAGRGLFATSRLRARQTALAHPG